MGKKYWGLGLAVVILSGVIANSSVIRGEKKRRALVIGLDGTTGDQLHYRALIQGKAPVLANLMTTGKFTPCYDEKNRKKSYLDSRCARAQSGHRTGRDFKWLTAPGWCSVLTGVDNSKHGVKDNSFKNISVFAQTSVEHPTFMKRLISSGLKTAGGGVANFLTAKKHGDIHPGVLDYECGSDSKHRSLVSVNALSSCNLTARQPGDGSADDRDENLTRFLETEIANPDIDVSMGVFDKVDSAGHWSGGFSGNKNYLEAISTVDVLVGRLILAIETRVKETQEEWLVIVTADHGGHNIALYWGIHGTRDHQDDAIPFIVKTFGSSQPLHELIYPVSHMDVHPTLMEWFGLPPTPNLDGHSQAI